jgi:hypothetical protein
MRRKAAIRLMLAGMLKSAPEHHRSAYHFGACAQHRGEKHLQKTMDHLGGDIRE